VVSKSIKFKLHLVNSWQKLQRDGKMGTLRQDVRPMFPVELLGLFRPGERCFFVFYEVGSCCGFALCDALGCVMIFSMWYICIWYMNIIYIYIWIIWIIYEYHTNNYWKYHSSCLQVPKTIQHPSHPRLRLSHFKKSPYGETAGQGQHWQSAGESINTIATTPQPHKNHSKIVYCILYMYIL